MQGMKTLGWRFALSTLLISTLIFAGCGKKKTVAENDQGKAKSKSSGFQPPKLGQGDKDRSFGNKKKNKFQLPPGTSSFSRPDDKGTQPKQPRSNSGNNPTRPKNGSLQNDPRKNTPPPVDEGDFFITSFHPTRSTFSNPSNAAFTQKSLLNRDVMLLKEKFMQVGLDKLKSNLPDNYSSKEKLEFAKAATQMMTVKAIEYEPRNFKTLFETAKAVSSTHPERDDPFLNTCIAKVCLEYDSALALKHADAAVKGFKNSDYPARIVIQAHLIRCACKEQSKTYFPVHVKQLAETLLYWLAKDLRATPDEYRFISENIESVFRHLSKRPREMPDVISVFETESRIPQLLREMALGYANNRMAWNARGDGMAGTVSQKGWKDFERYQRKAAVHFKNAHNANPYFPQAATAMIDIGRAGNINESARQWFDQAVKAQFDYYPAYNGMIFTLYPRWHGSLSEMIAFGQECLATGRFDTQVPFYYVMALNRACTEALSDDIGGASNLIQQKGVYADLVKIVESYVEREDAPKTGMLSQNYLYSMLAGMAFQAGRPDESKKLLDFVGDNFRPDAFSISMVAQSPEIVRANIYAIDAIGRKEYGDFMQQVQQTITLEDTQKLLKKIETKLAAAKSEPEKTFWKLHLKNAKMINDYNDGKVIDRLFEFGFSTFAGYGSYLVDVESEESINVKMHTSSNGFRYPFVMLLKGPKIIQYEIEQTKQLTANNGNSSLKANYCPGLCIQGRGQWQFYVLHDLQFDCLVFAGQGQAYRSVRMQKQKGTMEIRIGERYIEAYCNGLLIFRTRLANLGDSAQISLATGLGYTGRGDVRYKNIRLKKWELGPPPISINDRDYDYEKLEAYFERATKLEPNRAEHWKHLGMLQHRKGAYDDAVKSFNKALQMGETKRFIGFYLGDIYERKGQIGKAKAEYRASASMGEFSEIEPAGYIKSYWNNPQRMASLRYRWLHATDPNTRSVDPKKLSDVFQGFTTLPGPKHFPEWATRRVRAAENALGNRMDQAFRQMQGLPQVPSNWRAETNRQMTSYRNKQRFQPAAGKQFYMDLPFESFHYRFWDHMVPEDRANMHQ